MRIEPTIVFNEDEYQVLVEAARAWAGIQANFDLEDADKAYTQQDVGDLRCRGGRRITGRPHPPRPVGQV